MRAYQFRVRTTTDDDGPVVEVSQDGDYDNGHVIWLNPDQVDTLIEWLRRAQAEARVVK